jgi:putative hydrolase of the HAD superfamily
VTAPGGVDLVLFDLDDTLLDHRGAVAAGLGSWVPELLGHPCTAEFVTAWLAVEEHHMGRWRRGELSFVEQRRERLRRLLPRAARPDTDAGLDALFDRWLIHYRAAWRLFPDVLPCLDALRRAGLRTGVLTNGMRDQQNDKIARTGLTTWFSGVVTAEEIGVAKPAPAAFEQACRLLGSPPSRTVYVGDSYPVDVVGAQAAGLCAVLVDRDGTAGPALDVVTVRSLVELAVLVPRLG